MGGLSTAVTSETRDVFFEAAFFPPAAMAGIARQYGMHTDASMRFERGVDFGNQARAIEHATRLLLDIAGGEAGPLVDHRVEEALPEPASLELRMSRLEQVLGAQIPSETVSGILERLELGAEFENDRWTVAIPSHRFDIDVEDALVEEVARIFGYDNIPKATGHGGTPLAPAPEGRIHTDSLADLLVARDYQEVITYSFVDEKLDSMLSGEVSSLRLSNPISSEMSVMRSSIWPGLIKATVANVTRQQGRIRFFEIGKTFHGDVDAPAEVVRLALALTGERYEKQWGSSAQPVDFFDIKADVEALLATTGHADEFHFVAGEHSALQVGQTANIYRQETPVGVVGKLHPKLVNALDLPTDVYLVELDVELCFAAAIPVATTVSKYPAIRRDIAVVVDEKLAASELTDAVAKAAPELVQSVRIFDVYQGKGVEAGLKSIALGLILQGTSRTLTDDDADTVMSTILGKLQQDFGAELRD